MAQEDTVGKVTGEAPRNFFHPLSVGCRGWIGIQLEGIGDEEPVSLVRAAWHIAAAKKRAAR